MVGLYTQVVRKAVDQIFGRGRLGLTHICLFKQW
jgi:hypothetical protein